DHRRNVAMPRNRLALVILIALPLAVFAQTWNFEFVWDDAANIVNNRYLNPPSVANLVQFWRGPYERLYIPLTYSVWWATTALAGGSGSGPSVFHLANGLMHILSTLVVFAVLKILIRQHWAACAGALLFALHPLQVEPVAWITGMKDVLSGFLSLLALWQ